MKIADRSLLSLTWPIFIDLFFVFLISIVDVWFLSRVSDNAVAAVGAILPISGVGLVLYNTLSQAGGSIASQRLGAKDDKNVAGAYGGLLILSLLVGIVLAVILITGANTFSMWMGLGGELALISQSYLTILGMGTWILALRFAMNAVLSSQGKTRWNMYSTAIMSAVNLLFNYLLIDGKLGAPSLGVEGIAIATVLAWTASLLFSLTVVVWHCKIAIDLPRTWQSFKAMVRPIVNIALPSVTVPVSIQLSQLVMSSMAASMGDMQLATRIYAYNLLYIGMLYGFAISSGVQIKVAYFIGALQYDKAQAELIKGVKIGVTGIVLFVLTLVMFSDTFYAAFTDNKAIWALGGTILLVAIVAELGRLINLVVGVSLRACGDAKFTAMVGFVSLWFIALPLAWFMGLHLGWGLIGLWIGSSVDEVIRSSTNILRWRSGKWRGTGLYHKPGG